MQAWADSDPIDCTQLQRDKKKVQRAIDFEKSLEGKRLTGENPQNKNQTGVLLYDRAKETCNQSNTG
ncbi:hypothetical protein [Brevibacillus laterosporus]|uniref:hypothetical protein n=1 Tax=Brevibacillus laterosporus TaxID=1465 RepID=UPI003D1BAE34